jgi:hypothetical protein
MTIFPRTPHLPQQPMNKFSFVLQWKLISRNQSSFCCSPENPCAPPFALLCFRLLLLLRFL